MFSILNFDIQQMNEQFCETDRHAFYSNQTSTLLINETEKLFFRSIIFILPFIYLSLSRSFPFAWFCFVSGHCLFPRSIRYKNESTILQKWFWLPDGFAFNRVRSHPHANCKVYRIFIPLKSAKHRAREKKPFAGWILKRRREKPCGARCTMLFLLLIWLWWADSGELENMTFAIVQAICFRHNRIKNSIGINHIRNLIRFLHLPRFELGEFFQQTSVQ